MIKNPIFPECVARVPVSLWATVRNPAQPFATVRNRPRDPRMAVPIISSAKRGHFWRFHMWRCFVSRGTRGTSWHSDVLVTCRKSFCVAGAILWCRFHKMSCNSRGRRSTLDVSISICVAGAVSRIFCESHWQGGVKWRQGANGILWDVMKIDGSLARNIAFEVANFQVLRKTRRKTAILKLQSVKIGGVSLLGLMLPRVSSRVSGFPVASPCLWGKLQNLSFSNVSKQVVMSFCVAGAALCDIPTSLITCRKSFCVAGAILWCRFHKMSCSFRGRRSILEISVVILRGRRSTPHSTLYTSHSTLYISTLYTPHCKLHTLLHTWHFPPYTSHSTLYTPHFTLHTLHSTLYTLRFPSHSTLPHSILHILHFIPYTLHSTLHTRHFTLYTLHSALYTLHSTLYTPHCTLHTLLHTVHPPLSTSHFTLYVSHVRFGSWRLDFVAVLFVRLLWFYQFLLSWNLNDLNILISNSSLQK